MIAEGRKTYELRRRPPPQNAVGSVAFVYASAPASRVLCVCRIDDIVSVKKERLWSQIGDRTGCTKREYDDYFDGCEMASAIQLRLLDLPFRKKSRWELMTEFQFTPPQSWRWADQLEQLIG